jgi:tetratricopeptide (TPR) repeat protein
VKWIFWVLAIALVLIGMDFLLGDDQKKQNLSHDTLACSLYEDGIKDLFAFRFDASVEKFDRVLELDPSFAEAGIGLARAYDSLGRQAELLASLAHADSLTALIEDPRRRMFAQLRISGFSKSASRAFRDSLIERLRVEEPDNIFVLDALADIANRARKSDEAEKLWRRILEIDPNYAESYNKLGYLELHRANYDLAIEHMQKYAFLAPGSANPHDSLGDVYRVLGRYEEAELEYKQALKIQPDFFYSLINLGRIYLARGQLEVGFGILEKVRAEVAGTKHVRDIDGEILGTYFSAGMREETALATAHYIANYPDASRTTLYRALQLAFKGEMDQSRALMDSVLTYERTAKGYKEKVWSRVHTESNSLLYAGIRADLIGTPAFRVEAWRKSVSFIEEKIPFQDQWYNRRRLAQALFDVGRPDEAQSVLEPMLRVNPYLINCLVLAVECNLVLERDEAARQFMDQLNRSLARADTEFPAKKRAPVLEALVIGLERRS